MRASNQGAYTTNVKTCINTPADILKIKRQPVSPWEAHFCYALLESQEQLLARFRDNSKPLTMSGHSSPPILVPPIITYCAYFYFLETDQVLGITRQSWNPN